MVHIDIAINGAFLTRRWEEPENWMRLTRELGFPYHSFCMDVLDPFFSGDRTHQMETAAAVREAAARFLRDTRAAHGCPVRLTLDVGHQAGMHYGLSGPDLDYREWIRRFGAGTEIIHLQQTTPDASHHWPFTAAYNERGHIRIDAVLDAIRASHRAAADNPAGQPVPAVQQTYLIAEIIPGSTKTEAALLAELKESCEYLR